VAEKKTVWKNTVGKPAKKADDEAAVLAKIAAWRAPSSAMGERRHALILPSAPNSSRNFSTACRDK
jgi:hypothetical protein